MRKGKRTKYIPVLIVMGVFMLIALALIGQNRWSKSRTSSDPGLKLLSREELSEEEIESAGQDTVTTPVKGEHYECLYLWDSEDSNSEILHQQMPRILQDMKVSFVEMDIKDNPSINPENYDKIIIGFTRFRKSKNFLTDIMDWVEDGGGLLVAQVPEVNSLYTWICPKLGIADVGKTNHRIEGFRVKNEFMLTDADGEYRITDAFDSSNTVSLDSECKVYLESTDASELPLLWERDYGKGKTVTINFGIYEKPYRGIYAAGYSLLGSACAYPVINGSAFYIDDFPSPIPGGSNEYIEEDYGMDMKEFYSQIWWKDLSNLAEKYEFPYTGTVIEAYSEQVEAPFERNMDPWRYEYFGGLLIKQGGEIGLHGYNHMPLCLKNFQLPEGYEGYEKWSTTENMKLSLEELREFCQELFPDEKFQVYVPAANILSDEARKMIGKDFPEIRSIASMYLPEDILYDQEFEVAKDGIVECPRVTSGLIVNDYNRIAAFSELNMHYVNTHYQHPNEVMIEASGAAMGWEKQFENFSDYVEWVYEAAPDIRSLTGSELAGAVQRFYCVDVESKETKKGLTLTLEQFHEEAWVMVRFNDWEPDTESVKGGSLTKLGGNLYLLEAKQDKVTIEKRR